MGCQKSKVKKEAPDSSGKVKDNAEVEENNRNVRDVQRFKMMHAKDLIKYELKTLIGKGKFGVVFMAEDKNTKRPCAIKFPKDKEEITRQSLAHECQNLTSLKHENIVQLVELISCRSIGSVLLVMDLAVGGSLHEKIRLRKGIAPESEVIRIITMLLKAVRYLHVDCCTTHRDIKPSNVLFYHTGIDSKIMLTGFQHAYSKQDGNDDYMMDYHVGSSDYKAPEMLNQTPYTCAVDLWAVGVVTYMALTGSHPFQTKEKSDRHNLILQGEFNTHSTKWQSVSASGQEFISKLLKVLPMSRSNSSVALCDKWLGQEFLEEEMYGGFETDSSTPSPVNSSKIYRIKIRRKRR